MSTITVTVRKGLDLVSETTDRPGIGAVLGMIERTGRGDNARYTPLNLDMDQLADPQLSSASAVAILIQSREA